MKNKLKEMKGITLIALVITIIVLLILAGVSIATLTGENGILTQANSAKERNKEAEADEMFKLIANEWQIEKRKTGARNLETFLAEEADDYGVSVEDGNVLVYNGEKVQIDNNGTLTKVNEEEEPAVLAAGLYDADGNMTKSWDQLIADGDLVVENGELIANMPCEMPIGDSQRHFKGFGPSKLIIDTSVTSIANSGFHCALCGQGACEDLIEVVIPDSVTKIGDNSFSETPLSSVTIGNNVTSIDRCAFFYCNNLTNINYNGTKNEWQNIDLDEEWNRGCQEITVHCTDGDIVIPANQE